MSRFRFTKGLVSDVRVFFSDEDYRVLLNLIHELSWEGHEGHEDETVESFGQLLEVFDFSFPITPDNAGQFVRSLVYLLAKKHVLLQGRILNNAARTGRPFGYLSTREVVMLSNLVSEYCSTDLGVYLKSSSEDLVLIGDNFRRINDEDGCHSAGRFYYPQHGWGRTGKHRLAAYSRPDGVVVEMSASQLSYLASTRISAVAGSKE